MYDLLVKKILVVIAEGSEELEAVSIIDVMRRAKAEVDVASIGEKRVRCSKGVELLAEKGIEEVVDEDYHLIAIPGGMPGAQNIVGSQAFARALKRHFEKGGLVGAICAAPAIVLEGLGITSGRRLTCHPAFSHLVREGIYEGLPIVADGNLITARGAGQAIEFALRLLEALFDRQTVEEVKAGMAIL